MYLPKEYEKPQGIEPRPRTKTSLTAPKPAIALLVGLWYAEEKQSVVDYGERINDVIQLSSIQLDKLHAFFSKYSKTKILFNDLKEWANATNLVTDQLEPLNVAFEVTLRLASIEYQTSMAKSAERKNSVRYPKRILYSANMDIIDISFGNDLSDLTSVLLNWLSNNVIPTNNGMEERICKLLTVFSETAMCMTGPESLGYYYTTSGLYGSLLANETPVSLTQPNPNKPDKPDTPGERTGAARTIYSIISSDMHTYLRMTPRKAGYVELRPNVQVDELKQYNMRVLRSFELSNVKVGIMKRKLFNNTIYSGISRNLIFFGAPGTGKSYQLNRIGVRTDDNHEGLFAEKNVRRVTFYPDYTYSQFVGIFRPYVKEDGSVTYRYSPGPFLETYIDSILHPNDGYLLIIEEINRSNPASVFGDVFQLLDRNHDGWGEYSVSVTSEMKKCIKHELDKLGPDDRDAIEDYFNPMTFDEFSQDVLDELQLPPNMYIWATMNSADQGVFPMDTAFKRRWDFRYMGINEGEDATPSALGGERLSNRAITIGDKRVVWNELRKAINMLLLDNHVNEDKLLGPFFLSPEALNDEPHGDTGKSRFVAAFEDKVLLYLFEDAGKMKRKSIFWDGDATFANVCIEFEKSGLNVFRQESGKHKDIFSSVYLTDVDTVTSGQDSDGSESVEDSPKLGYVDNDADGATTPKQPGIADEKILEE